MHNLTQGQSTRDYCSESNGPEPLWGTADPVDVWLMLEYRSVWKARALEDNGLAERVREWLDHTLTGLAAAGYRARPQFIRRPEIDDGRTRLLVASNDTVQEFSGAGYGFLDGVDVAACLHDPNRGDRISEPLYFVCTNGQRDLCCAKFGLPLYVALRERIGARVWQVNHLGGHRFAPNVLALPSACLYGRVIPDRVDDFLAQTEQGKVDFQRLRGRTRYPQMVQAAEACIAQNGLKVLQVDGDEREAVITFADDIQLLKVAVKRSDESLMVLKSCGDEGPQRVYPYVATKI